MRYTQIRQHNEELCSLHSLPRWRQPSPSHRSPELSPATWAGASSIPAVSARGVGSSTENGRLVLQQVEASRTYRGDAETSGLRCFVCSGFHCVYGWISCEILKKKISRSEKKPSSWTESRKDSKRLEPKQAWKTGAIYWLNTWY